MCLIAGLNEKKVLGVVWSAYIVYVGIFVQIFRVNTVFFFWQSNLGSNQWLFNADLDKTKVPALCLRHDVDGLLWQPESPAQNEPPWKHIATFNAFGYVQASKETRKFTTCPPNCSYAVITDTVRHLYMYRQAVSVATPLRNRKTGQQVSSVAKQQVVSLEAVDNIVGLQATNEKLFVMTEGTLHMIKVWKK